MNGKPIYKSGHKFKHQQTTQLEGVEYGVLILDRIPNDFTFVPVGVNDYGQKYKATMVADSVRIAALGSLKQESTAAESESLEAHTAIQPVSGWWMYQNKGK